VIQYMYIHLLQAILEPRIADFMHYTMTIAKEYLF